MDTNGSQNALILSVACDVGNVRTRNEDAVGIDGVFLRDTVEVHRVQAGDVALISVADGVGGAAAGDIASKFVVQEMDRALRTTLPEDRRLVPPDVLAETARGVNDLLMDQARSDPALSGMATTYTCAIVRGQHCQWVHAGDSRLLHYSDGELQQVTRDHTLREMSGDPRIPGNIIVNCFGGAGKFFVDSGEVQLNPESILVLCSDGFTDYADMDAVPAVLAGASAEDAAGMEKVARDLVALAKEGGGGDNITVVLVAICDE